MIYFDYNATSPTRQSAINELTNIAYMPLNASSVHSVGRRAKAMLDKAREELLRLLDANDDYVVIFTSGGTEANNIMLNTDLVKITTTVEHSSVLKTNADYAIPVDRSGMIDIEALRLALEAVGKRCLVSVQLANNETGVIQNIQEISEIIKQHDAILHSDITQAVGKIPVSIHQLGCDAVSLSAHKFGGGLGVGALIVKKGIDIRPLAVGGGQELRYRPGTHNIPAILGMVTGLREALHDISEYIRIENLRNDMEAQILQFCNEAIIFGGSSKRLPNTSCIGMPNVKNETQVIYFDLKGFAVSAGAACSSGTLGLPHVQMSMGYDHEIASTAIRVSLGAQNTKDEVERFIERWKQLYREQNG